MLNVIYTHIEEAAAIVLFAIGFPTLLLNKNLIKKIIGFSMMDNAIYLFLASYGYIAGRAAPIQAPRTRRGTAQPESTGWLAFHSSSLVKHHKSGADGLHQRIGHQAHQHVHGDESAEDDAQRPLCAQAFERSPLHR